MTTREKINAAAKEAGLTARSNGCYAVSYFLEIERFYAIAFEAGAARKRDAIPEWQPIETAPRGVLEILLRSPNGKIANGYWGQECNRGKGAWVWPYVKSEPSHWMPLPAAPKGEE